MEKEEDMITEQDLFGDKKEDSVVKEETPSKKKDGIPQHYIPIKFNSLGKLTAPPQLHFRNFSPNEAAKLAVAPEDEEYRVFIDCFNAMVWENFDCSYLHIKELLTILYTLHGSFFSETIEKKYYIDEDLDEPELSDEYNIDTAEINIGDLQTKTLPKEFKEPITITSSVTQQSAQFIFPRVGFAVKAQNYLEEKYRKEIMDFYDLKSKIQEITSIKDMDKREEEYYKIPQEKRMEYDRFERMYWEEFVIIMNALCIQKVGSKSAKTIKEHIKLSEQIDRNMQEKFNRLQEEYNFGVQDEVEYYSVKQQKKLTRRFQFRFQDFLSDSKQPEADSRFDVQFG